MDLLVRHRTATGLQQDARYKVSSSEEWRERIEQLYREESGLLSSLLLPTKPLFPIGESRQVRRHPHEKNYQNIPERNGSFREACQTLAHKIEPILDSLDDRTQNKRRALVYVPLRGALPIWRTVAQFLDTSRIDVYYPVTSSFVMFPPESGITKPSGKRASGRYNNILELERIKPFLNRYASFVYIDEIISGGMLRGHVKEMVKLAVGKRLPVVVGGLADRYGERRSRSLESQMETYMKRGAIHQFLWEGCQQLITEDQKFLLGIHYADYEFGPHIVPVLNENFEYYEEKRNFDEAVLGRCIDLDLT